MSYQLIYTSAAELLEPGQTGFGTVACSRGLSRGLMKRIENLCIYKTDSLISGAQYTYRIIDCIGKTYHIFSRAVKCPSDYSGRNNYIIHQIIFLKEELRKLRNSGHVITPSGLFLSLLEDDFWLNEWTGAPRYIEQEPNLQGRSSGDAYDHTTWKNLTGHRSNSNILNNPPFEHDCLLTIPSGINSQDILKLLNESDAMSAKLGWDKTFTSHGEIQDSFSETQRIAVNENSPLENRARRTGRPILRINKELHLPAIERDTKPIRTENPQLRSSSSRADNKSPWQGTTARPNQGSLTHTRTTKPDSIASLKEHVKVVLSSKKSRLTKLARRSKNKAGKLAISISSILVICIIVSLIYHIKEDKNAELALIVQKEKNAELTLKVQENKTILAEIKNINQKINREISKETLRNHIASLDTSLSTAIAANNLQASPSQKNESYEEALSAVKEILLAEIEKINQQIKQNLNKPELANHEESIFNPLPNADFIQKNISYQQLLQSFKEILAEQYHPVNTRLKLINLNKQLAQRYQSPMLAEHEMYDNLQESVRILSAERKGNKLNKKDLKNLIYNAEELRLSTHNIARLYLELNASPTQFEQASAASNSSSAQLDTYNTQNTKSQKHPEANSKAAKKVIAIVAGTQLPEKLKKLLKTNPCILKNGHIIASCHDQPNLGIRFSPDGEHLHIEGIGPSYYRLTISNKGGINTGNLMQLYASDKFQGFLMNGLPSFLELSVQYPTGNESYIFLPFYSFELRGDEDTKPIPSPEEHPLYINEEDLLISNDIHGKQQHASLALSETALQSYPWKSVITQIPLKEGQTIKLPKLPGFLKSELINVDAQTDNSFAPQALESLSWGASPKAEVELLSAEYNIYLRRKIDLSIPLQRAFHELVNKSLSSTNSKADGFYSIATLYSSIERMGWGHEKGVKAKKNSPHAKAYSDYIKLLENKNFNTVIADILGSAPQYYLSTATALSTSKDAMIAKSKLERRLSMPSSRKQLSKLIRKYIQDELSQVYDKLSESLSKDSNIPALQLELDKVEAGDGILRWFFKLQKAKK